jgi:hypothetical protein
MGRRTVPSWCVATLTSLVISLGALGASAAPAGASPISLVLGQGEAFSLLGHSCGGIQEKAYATGFGADGYPTGDVYMQTRCGGSGRGGGYKTTTYSAWASVRWNWFGQVLSFARLEGAAQENTTFSEEDAYRDREYNSGTAAFLETGNPPYQPPAAATEVSAYVVVAVDPEVPTPDQLQVAWTPAAATARFITSSTVTATPVGGSSSPVLSTTVNGAGTSTTLGPLVRGTTYSITVTNTDLEGTSTPSVPVEATDTHVEEGTGAQPPDWGRCLKVPAGTGEFATATCTTQADPGTGAYEWFPGAANGAFTSSLRAGTTAMLETTGGSRVVCTGGGSEGTVSGPNTVDGVIYTFTGCSSGGSACTSPGLGEGELRTSELQGTLGIERVTEVQGRQVEHVAIALGNEDGEPFLEYACGAEAPVTVSGSVLAPVVSNNMLRTRALKFTQRLGRQKPEALEGGVPQVLLSSLGEQVGLSLSSTLTSEEAIEINTTV